MLNRGLLFLKKLNEARAKIVKLAGQFIVDGSVSNNILLKFYLERVFSANINSFKI